MPHCFDSRPPSRRRFLNLIAGTTAFAGAPLWLAGCGGGGDGGNDGAGTPEAPTEPDVPAGGDAADAARLATIAAIETHCRALEPQQLAPLAYVEAVAARMAASGGYAHTGVDAGTLTACGIFEDGRVHLVARNRFVEPETKAMSTLAAPAMRELAARVEVPASRQARVIHSFGPRFDGQSTVTQLGSLLSAHGYTVRPGAEGDGRLTTLRAVQGDGFFYLNAHGGAWAHVLRNDKDAPYLYSVQSSTPVTAATEAMPDIRDDMANLRLTYFTADTGERENVDGKMVPVLQTRYGITAEFVTRYWQFADHSVVIINACSSANTSSTAHAGGFIFACHSRGAGVYLGWTETVSAAGAYSAPPYFVDRLLGANVIEPESPRQRAFAWDDVIADMDRKGRSTDPESGARFVGKPRPGSAASSILAPTIHHVEVDERNNQLRILGQLGTQTGKVYIDSTERQVRSWTNDLVVCDLPASGMGSAGGVYVKVDEHRSNVRQVTEWRMPVDYQWLDQTRNGLRVDGSMVLRWRADVGKVREAPGRAPTNPVRFATGARDTGMWLSASGAYPVDKYCTVTWSDSADFGSQLDMIDGDNSTAGRFIFANLRVDTATSTGHIGLALGAPASAPMFTEHGCRGAEKFVTALGLLDEVVEFEVVGATAKLPLPALSVDFGSNYAILGNSHSDDELRLRWNDVVPNFPPLSDSAV